VARTFLSAFRARGARATRALPDKRFGRYSSYIPN
jgi:hypothetical protein